MRNLALWAGINRLVFVYLQIAINSSTLHSNARSSLLQKLSRQRRRHHQSDHCWRMAFRSHVSIFDRIEGQSFFRHSTLRVGGTRGSRGPNNVILDLPTPALTPNCNFAFVRFNLITSTRMKSTLRVHRLHLRRDLSEWNPAVTVTSVWGRSQQQCHLNLVTEGPLVAQKMLRMLT